MTPEQIAVQFEHQEQEIKSLSHRVKRCEEQQATLHRMAVSVETMAVNMEYMAREQKAQGERLERLEHEPAEEYKHYRRTIIGCIITTILGAVLGALLATIL